MPTILETLGELPSGKTVPLTVNQLGTFLRDNYISGEPADARRKKKQRLAKRLDYFHDRTTAHYEAIIRNVFTNAKVQQKARTFLPYIKAQNLIRRVVEEISTVYSEAADRAVAAGDETYQDLLALPSVRINTRQRQANELVNLMNQCLEWFFVREHDKQPELRLFTPDFYDAVSHPNDPLRWIGVIFPVERRGFANDVAQPKHQVWTEHETFALNGNGFIMDETWVKHGFEGIPGVLVNRKAPVEELTDFDSGEDLVSAQEAVALLNLLLIKANKSSVRAPYIAGDIGRTATGQPLDDEELLSFQEGIAPGTLDLRADPSALISSIQFYIKQIAANYGIPASVFDLSYQASSGFEIELKRTGLREKRHQQIMDPWRPAEKDLASVMSDVLTGEFAFSDEGWHIDFGQFDTPQDPAQRLQVWDTRREMSLMTTEQMVMQENPEFTLEQAKAFLKDNVIAQAQLSNQRRVLMGPPVAAGGPPQQEDEDEEDEDAPEVSQPRNGPPPRVQ